MTLQLKMKALVEAAAFTGFDQTNPVRKDRQWKTDEVTYDGQRRQAQEIWDEPLRHFFINWSVLDAAARNKIREIFDAARGRADTFLWLDDDEYLCENEQITADGSSTQYQLVCTYYPGEDYEWTETKIDIVEGSIYAPTVTHSIDGAQTETATNPPVNPNEFYLDDTTGIMTWAAAHPPSAGVLTVTFEYYFRVAFVDDRWSSILQHGTPLYTQNELHIKEIKPWDQ